MSGACLEGRYWYNNEQVLTIEVKQPPDPRKSGPKETFEQKVRAITDDNLTAVGDSTVAGWRRGCPTCLTSSSSRW
jgi:hypothetical protein